MSIMYKCDRCGATIKNPYVHDVRVVKNNPRAHGEVMVDDFNYLFRRRNKRTMLSRFKKCLDRKEYYMHVDNDASYCLEYGEDGTVYIYFEWSNGVVDWKNNFNFPARPYRFMDKGGWFCHRGFLKVWKSIEPYLKGIIMAPDLKKIEIIGYSHGGAIAQLCHEYVKYNRPDIEVKGFGFGAPRVFWGFASKSVKKRFEGFTVIRNGNDIVTHLPPVIFGFRHVADVVKIGEGVGLIKDHYAENYIKNLEK